MRTAIWFAVLAIRLVALVPRSIRLNMLAKKGETEKKDAVTKKTVKNIAVKMSALAGIKVEVAGRENIPEGSVVYCANHLGMFDPAIMAGYVDQCGFVMKKELEKVPFLKTWMKHLCSVFVDRDNPRAAVKSIAEATEFLKEGRSMIIFPEGTRGKGGKIGEFKNGAFKMAQKAGVPIVPVAICGTDKVWEAEHKIRPAAVKIKIMPPVCPKGMEREEFREIGPKIRAMIENAFIYE
ncbi:MAG: 1-acyl-sn-glycerol-3-phosphate acyltransferase [Oscillospiraceae bacterium]|nr:1-acyl-sn-glycerol-3-phosphate acyltransferase [Oscillospiraceae bacterium]